MIPPQLVVLDAFPLTANGKVNRNALPAPSETLEASKREFVAPQTSAEKALAEVWQEVLGLEHVSVNDNFFDLGGDSIRSIQVHARAEKRGYEFSVRQIFQYQTIAELAREAKSIAAGSRKSSGTEPFSLIGPDDRFELPDEIEDAYPLSLLQRGMLYHTDLSRELALYHVIFSCKVKGSLDIEALREGMQILAARYPVLRTSFDLYRNGEPLQLVHRKVTVPFLITDLSHLSATEQHEAIAAWKEEDKKQSFEWSSAPVLRSRVFICGETESYVTVSVHHSILDGWSMNSMLSEWFSLYLELRDGGEITVEPEPLQTTYRDFIALELQSLQSEEVRNYWSDKLATLPFTPVPPREGHATTRAAPEGGSTTFR